MSKNQPVDISGRAWLELGLLSAFWGGTFFAVAIALQQIGPLTAVLHRVGWAALILWAVAFAQGHRIPRDARLWGAFLMMGLLNNVIPFGLMSWGQTHLPSGLVSIFNAMTAPLAVLVAALVLRDEPLTGRRLLGVGLGVVGVITVMGVGALGALDLRALAQWAVIAGTVSYAFAGVWAKLYLRGITPVVAAAGMLTGSTLIMLPVTLWAEGVPSLALAPETWGAIAYYAVFATAGAYLLYYRVLAMAGTGNLLLCTLVIPPIAIMLGWLFLHERLEAQAFVGFGVIALGLAVIDGRILKRTLR